MAKKPKRKRVKRGRLPHAERAGIDPKKLRDYVLSADHPDKSLGFAVHLGIHRDDWRFLHDQILERISEGQLRLVRIATNDRLEWTVFIPIDGRNGLRKLIATCWSLDARHEPWLTSAWVADKQQESA